MPEARIALGQICTYLACAPKSNAAYKAINAALQFVKKDGTRSVPQHIADPPVGYKYPHDYPTGYVEQNYWYEGTPIQNSIPLPNLEMNVSLENDCCGGKDKKEYICIKVFFEISTQQYRIGYLILNLYF